MLEVWRLILVLTLEIYHMPCAFAEIGQLHYGMYGICLDLELASAAFHGLCLFEGRPF
jgi:hypothetical protein